MTRSARSKPRVPALVGVPADATSLEATERVRERIESGLGAWIRRRLRRQRKCPTGPVHELSEEERHSTVDGNLTATFLTMKTFLPGMIERRAGSIMTKASSAGRTPTPAARARARQRKPASSC